MRIPRSYARLFVLFGVAVIVGLAAVGVPRLARAVPRMQGATCGWKSIGRTSTDLFHVAYALDSDANQLYVYGGMETSFDAKGYLEQYDLSAADLATAGSKVSVAGALNLAGAAGAYRAKGKDQDESAAYFFGGMADPSRGQSDNDVQRYVPKTRDWEKLTPGHSTSFSPRTFAAAAYDPVHDVLWVVGGVATCKLGDVLPPNSKACQARSIDTVYLSFDATTGAPEWNVLSGGSQSVFGHTLAYDPAGQRLLLFGGTNDIRTGSSTVKALDLSDPDPSKASWSTVATSGTAPQVFFHGAGFDTVNNRLVVYGGVKRDFLQEKEQVSSGVTNVLDFNQTPAAWSDLRPSGTPGDRVGAAMVYDPLHQAQVITLGRQKITFQTQPTPTPPSPQPSGQTTVYGLTCGAPVPTTQPPPTRTATPTLPPSATPTATGPTPTQTIAPSATETQPPTETPTVTPGTPTQVPSDTPAVTETPTETEVPSTFDIYLPYAFCPE